MTIELVRNVNNSLNATINTTKLKIFMTKMFIEKGCPLLVEDRHILTVGGDFSIKNALQFL